MGVKIVQPAPPAEEVDTAVIATALVDISEGIARLRAGRLNEKALLLLIQHACPSVSRPSAGTIKTVLSAVENLKREYVRGK